jgi:hypothetical protein
MIADYLKTAVFDCGANPPPQSCKPPAEPTTRGPKAWRAIYSVLTSQGVSIATR